MRCSPADISLDALEDGEVAVPWIMHVQARLLNGVGDVGSCDGEVLQGAGDAAVLAWVLHSSTRGWQLRLRVDGRRGGLAVHHPGTFQELFSVLRLRQEEVCAATSHVDAEEEVQRAHVLHGKLSLEFVDDVPQQRVGGGRQHHVVDVEKKVRRRRTAPQHEE